MTDLEFETTIRLARVQTLKALIEDVADHGLIPDAEYQSMRQTIKSWETRLRDSLQVRRAPRKVEG